MSVKKVWQDEYKVHSYEVDMKGNATLPILSQFMQESAWNHAENLGVGFTHLMQKNFVWVLARQYIKIESYPKWGDTITLHTWPVKLDRLFAYRDFKIFNDQKDIIALASTSWFVIDLDSRKPQRPENYFHHSIVNTEHVLPGALKKIKSLNVNDHVDERNVRYKDLDVNGHVNNVKYIEWFLDGFPYDFQKSFHITEMSVNFLSEALFGDHVLTYVEDNKDSTFLHSLKRKNKNTELCRAKTIWSPGS